jgi:transcriptional regulator with PAS, ATPase and Fis domain
MMKNVLVSWIGQHDLNPSQGKNTGDGPILSALKELGKFTKIYLIANYPKKETDKYVSWLESQIDIEIVKENVKISSPIHFGDIHKAADSILEKVTKENKDCSIMIHLSPGTPAMAAVWILLGKTKYNTDFIQSSREKGTQDANIPFDITAEFLPGLTKSSDQKIQDIILSQPTDTSEFNDIITRNPLVHKEIKKAKKLALSGVPVLIQGESGTGKELFAKAIHKASSRNDQPIITVNCGALPKGLEDSSLFGHKKGSFTGAIENHKGFFEEANKGTIFLDEFGELPLSTQVKLLRVIQENEIIRVGETKTIKIDVRIITATNQNLIKKIQDGSFREDLFYRIAIGIITLPPLREREGDLNLLIDFLNKQISKELSLKGKYKKISIQGINFILKHNWPGNIRELKACLTRAIIWSEGKEITEDDIKESILTVSNQHDTVLNRNIGKGFILDDLLTEVENHYFDKALLESNQKTTKASELLGFKNYQTFKNRLEKSSKK